MRLARTCSLLVSVSMSFCTARVPCVLSATATRSPDAAAVFSSCNRRHDRSLSARLASRGDRHPVRADAWPVGFVRQPHNGRKYFSGNRASSARVNVRYLALPCSQRRLRRVCHSGSGLRSCTAPPGAAPRRSGPASSAPGSCQRGPSSAPPGSPAPPAAPATQPPALPHRTCAAGTCRGDIQVFTSRRAFNLDQCKVQFAQAMLSMQPGGTGVNEHAMGPFSSSASRGVTGCRKPHG